MLCSRASIEFGPRDTFLGNPVPRDQKLFSLDDKSYTYRFGGKTHKSVNLPENLRDVIHRILEFVRALGDDIKEPNAFVLNRYVSNQDSISEHSDDEPEMDKKKPILSFSFGAARKFYIRNKETRERVDFVLELLIMLPGMQQTHTHCLPKQKEPTGLRFNITMRYM
jgi:alkylated DNA repair dioxygenase AlkB